MKGIRSGTEVITDSQTVFTYQNYEGLLAQDSNHIPGSPSVTLAGSWPHILGETTDSLLQGRSLRTMALALSLTGCWVSEASSFQDPHLGFPSA